MVADHEQKEGTTSKGRPWVLTRMQDGNGEWYSTFDKGMGITILGLKGKKADITYELGEKGRDLKSITEHFEVKKAGSRFDDPVVQHRITVLACMKVAAEIVNGAASDTEDKRIGTADRTKAVKPLSADLAVWVDEYAERAANPPFLTDDQHDDVPFGEPEDG